LLDGHRGILTTARLVAMNVEGRSMAFALGRMYTREEIHQALGGAIQTYLPHREGRVVCGCFDPGAHMNPHAPEEILFGEPFPTPAIDETARMVFRQGQNGETIPVFLKRGSRKWEYIGEYLCIGFTQDHRVVKRKMQENPLRRAFSGVIRFERV
jgi:hypothetical protein